MPLGAPQAVADIVRTTLGPRAMLKMLLDANGGIVLTNDGNAILREIDVSHPAAKVQQRSGEGGCGHAAATSRPLVSRAPGAARLAAVRCGPQVALRRCKPGQQRACRLF